MTTQALTLQLTESYLKSLFAGEGNTVGAEFDSSASFAELSIDSFQVLKIIKRLEVDFGTLPKTLLFEHFTVHDLARYFVEKHSATLALKFETASAGGGGPGATASAESNTPRSGGAQPAAPLLILERKAYADPQLREIVQSLFDAYKNEGSVSRGARNIAPNLFIGGERRGYFNYCRGKNIILVYAYTGPDDYFQVIADEMYAYCSLHRFQLNIFSDREISAIGSRAFSSTPFGALQRILKLNEFTLEGGAMRRLRYQVTKFAKSGVCRTEEYKCGTSQATDHNIVAIIDEWCATKSMVNPLIQIVREEILAGSLHEQHRLFLTYVDEVLHNVILISAMAPVYKGYLMDLEFYTQAMPLGGLEFAIIKIIEALTAEGREMLSLGGTYGCRIGTSANVDPQLDKTLEALHQQNVFNDDGNLQFKNKFRTDNRIIYLCREVAESASDNIIDIIMMIADPAKMQTSDEENHGTQEPAGMAPTAACVAASAGDVPKGVVVAAMSDTDARAARLAACGFNPQNLLHEDVECDLKTDSWAQLHMAPIERHMKHLHSQLHQSLNVEESLRGIFPFAHFTLTTSGRAAEQIFYKAWPKTGIVIQNLTFPTGLFHQIDKGFTPVELPSSEVFRLNTTQLFKGDLAWGSLQERVAENPAGIAMVCIEVSNNASGGHPVSIQHLKQVRELLAKYAIPMVIDATRVVENAAFCIEHERGYANKELWSVVRELLSQADAVICSLAKDFCINKGGLVATNDAKLFKRLQELTHEEGCGLDVIDRKLLALSLQDRRRIESQVLRRKEWVALVWETLKARGVPVVEPAGAHCVLIDVKQMPEFKDFEQPVASFLAWMFANTGIRAGAHSVGMQKRTAINELVRVAIPLGLRRGQVEDIIDRVLKLFTQRASIANLVLASGAPAPLGDVHAVYAVKAAEPAAASVDLERTLLAAEVATPAVPVAVAPAAVVPVAIVPVAVAPAAVVPVAAPSPVAASTVVAAPGAMVAPSERAATATPLRHEPTDASAEAVGGKRVREQRDIAIVGMSGRYPMARTLADMWENLAAGKDCVREIPAERYQRRREYEAIDKYRGGFIDDVDKFDSLFFNISPREAEMLDPQERLFLEVAWEAIEDAGYHPDSLTGEGVPRDIGVFVGAVWTMYQMLGVEERQSGNLLSPNSFLWSIANRVSYFMNFVGPSVTLDTACSSSLTALYFACEAIYRGDCSAAIVGGVNLDLHQNKLRINLVGGALSKDGVCRSFGKGANGYVAGEGVGALLLKPLARAIEDGDNIHGVIKSVAVNHNGRSNGYGVPNPRSQSQLIVSALQKAGVDARSIGYIEAHGTGTELGDPIETTGLTSAFDTYAVEQQSCAVGSVKTNIGHLEAAAGVVGICKVLLQMKHGQLAPSLHSAELNEFIDFGRSPFYVVQKLEPWNPKVVDGARTPLRAGVSSFGAGGANAHVILEKYERPTRAETRNPVPTELVFPFSAKSEEQLREVAVRLARFIGSDSLALIGEMDYLRRVAFTLQVGRRSFDHRGVVFASCREELIAALDRFAEGKRDEKVLAGNVKNAEGVTKLLSRKEQETFVSLLASSRNSYKLAQLWSDGLFTEWQGLHSVGAGVRISLPTYPFADRRHWPRSLPRSSEQAATLVSGIHPLVDSNASTFVRQVFKKSFHERDFFIHDHLVADIPTLPGVAYLELARKAGELSAGRPVRRIRNILWLSPIAVQNSTPRDVSIELKPAGDTVQFEVFSESIDGKRVLHSQGKLLYATRQETEAAPEYIDLDGIRARCSKVMDGKDAYPLFKSIGLNLGPSFQVLKEVYKNDSETLGTLQLPTARHADLLNMILHPSLVDGSLQAGAAAQLQQSGGEMVVPYSIGEVEILHPLQTDCFSYVTVADEGRASRVSKANVLIVDPQGKILVRIKESTGVPLRDVHKKAAAVKDAEGFSTLYYSYEWSKLPLSAAKVAKADSAVLLFATNLDVYDAYRARLEPLGQRVVFVQPGEAFAEQSAASFRLNPREPQDFIRLLEALSRDQRTVEQVCFAWPVKLVSRPAGTDGGNLNEHLETGVFAFLYLCQALVKQRLEATVRLVYLYGAFLPCHDAINGFMKALRIEHPKLHCKTVQAGSPMSASRLVDLATAEFDAESTDAAGVRYDGGDRYVRRLKSLDLSGNAVPAATTEQSLRDHGVYVITGGAGGLGLIFANFLARKCQARLVLTGRSEPSDKLESVFEVLRASGAEVLYVRADVAQQADVDRLIDETKRRFGHINGIIHSAGVLRDSYLRSKSREEMDAVFAPKVYGTLNLDRATAPEKLDFFVTFSSLSAIGGNAGQCDYCFANHFMDSFASERESLRAQGTRSGKTLSLNWSLWADGGMQLDEQTKLLFTKTTGIKPLANATGLDAFIKGLSSEFSQVAVLEGLQEKIEMAWGIGKKEPATLPSPAATTGPRDMRDARDDGLFDQVQGTLSQMVMDFLKVEAQDISYDKVLLDLGFDSIGLATYANTINEKYGLDITPILFFDHPSIDAIAKYLVAERRAEVGKVHQPSALRAAPTSEPAQLATAGEFSSSIDKGWDPRLLAETAPAAVAPYSPDLRFVSQPIAIVGMSGVMPQSADLEEFWDNLKNARDLITVIPEERWNWEDYYGDPQKEANKSNSKWGGFMKEVDKFDAMFFGISPREAQMMDPQQRIFLETVWKAIEDSGQKVSDLSGTKTGLFVGVGTNDYVNLVNRLEVGIDAYTASGNSHSVLANRVSFLLNLRGPSAPLDTACSSSLVAVHRAIESIHSGSCDMAIVGGVQVMLNPAAYVSFGMAGMLSGDGKCKTFDKRANGYVRGEGVGAIFLKPLAAAERDGNHIYALVKATAENHGGRVTTLTAPNASAQAELLVEAYQKGQVDPATVGYIECHGTGTSLGDPIEVQGLSRAFAELYKRSKRSPPSEAHCGLSSVKTNIGHLETAAGIAGILKVLLAIKHRQIPASLHYEESNPYIDLKGTPFYVANSSVEWKAPRCDGGPPLPRRAGISSFGFGGANAHVVLEEYVDVRSASPLPASHLFVLSAKNEDRLRDYAKSLLAHLEAVDVNLADFHYTLQVGRDAMPERWAMVVSGAEELKQRLKTFVENDTAQPYGYRRGARDKKLKTASAGDKKLTDDAIQGFAAKGELGKIAESWVGGADVDWQSLYRAGSPKRLSLPTYPFARERHWIVPEKRADLGDQRRVIGEVQLHPLVHSNVSTLKEQKFASRFTGKEFFLADHVVETQKILPGVAYMEMARAAGQLAAEKDVRFIKGLVWLTPIVVSEVPKDVEVSLTPVQSDLSFRVTTRDKDRTVVHCSGKLGFAGTSSDIEALDIAGIQRRCTQQIMSGAELYPFLSESGLNLGRSFQIVQNIWANQSEALAVLRLPEHLKETAGTFWLHPALMDGSLHTAIGLMKNNQVDFPLSLPFSVAEIEIVRPLTDLHYGYATFAADDNNDSDGVLKMNFHLLDQNGNVLVRLKDFISKPLRRETLKAPAIRLNSMVPTWTALRDAAMPGAATEHGRVLVLGGDQTQFDWVRRSHSNAHWLELPSTLSIEVIETKLMGCPFDQLLWIAPNVASPALESIDAADTMIDEQDRGVLLVFRIVKALLNLGYGGKSLQWTLITKNTQRVGAEDALEPAHAGVAGFVGSLAKEYSRWDLRLLDVESTDSVTARECLSLAWDKQGLGLAHRRGEWFQPELALIDALPAATPAYRQGGVYVIVGGAGGLGEVLSRYLMERYQAKIVWLGRRPVDTVIEQKIGNMRRFGAPPLYLSVDARNVAALKTAFDAILAVYPAVHGVVHSALVLQDKSIAHMDEATFRASLSAKVDVCVNLARVFGAHALDFMLFFSSIVSFNRSPGQSNYAAGCTFKDGFAHWLQRQRAFATKIVNWGYWGNVGVVAEESYKTLMEQMGIGSIEPDEGMKALEHLLSANGLNQIALVKTINAHAADALDSLETISHHPAAPAILPIVIESLPPQVSAQQLAELSRELPSSEQSALATDIVASSLKSLGLFKNGVHTLASLQGGKSPALFYERWLQRCIRHLQDQHLLDERLAFSKPIASLEELWAGWNTRKPAWAAANANQAAQTLLLETCLKALPAVLSGQQLATDVIFPRSSMHLVEGIYRDNALADYFNEVMGATLSECIEQRRRHGQGSGLRILEIGAGTGGTTAKLIPRLGTFADSVVEYCYTDVSKAFLMYGTEHFGRSLRSFTTGLFDVTKPLKAQAIAAARYDFVIASNVLHATPSIRETLRNAKAALKPGGTLLLNEISAWSLFSHLTFGLLQGWWLYEDSALRLPGSPGLAPEKWREILTLEGFDATFFPAQGAHSLGQQIIAASSDGIVRQRVIAVPPCAPPAVLERPKAQVPRSDSATQQSGKEHVRQTIVGNLAEALKMDPGMVRSDDAFADYGVDSIIGVNLVRTISEALHIELETMSLFEHKTVNELTDHVWSNFGAQMSARAGGSASAPRREAAPVPVEKEMTVVHRFSEAEQVEATSSRDARRDSIAIIGASGRFAGSESLDEFWTNLRDGKDMVREVTRWSPSECVMSQSTAQGSCTHGSFVDSADLFDPAFFKISPLEALYMDPQQRLFLEESWKALEDAGYGGKHMQAKQCGVYVGCGNSKYEELFEDEPPPQAFWGNSESVIPARIAYYLDLQGPAIAVNTACSSSLVTIHLACQSLWSGETEMALAGGVFLQATSGFYQVSNRAGMLSAKGRCFSFDAAADGFVPGEGVGVLVLKRLDDARRDGDHIHGVIAGSGINQDGSSNGLIAPNAAAQERLERAVYERFKINPETIQVVEAHGTGTVLGDSIEFGAITRAFRQFTDKTQFCAIGSVKTNIGHAATAAGVAAVLKILVALKHRQIPPSLHFREGNPGIKFDSSPFYVNTELKDWPVETGGKRRAAISSFGFSGTNAHLVIEEAPRSARGAATRPGYLVVLSARSAAQLKEHARNLLLMAEQSAELPMNDLGYTLMLGRLHLTHRWACVARTPEQLIQSLKLWLDTGSENHVHVGEIQEGRTRERVSLKKFGTHCLQECQQSSDPVEYLDHLATLADLYVQGYALDYATLFPADSKRMPLPTYPFARERYWAGRAAGSSSRATAASVLHPLLHVNTSDLSQHSYTSIFTGHEPFWVDDTAALASGSAAKCLMPAAHLEMARAALERAIPAARKSAGLQLCDIVWADPIGMTKFEVTINVFVSDDEHIDFEIHSTDAELERIHCQGRAVLEPADTPSPLDLTQVAAQMRRSTLNSTEVYSALAAAGMSVAPAERVVTCVHRGEGELLALVSLTRPASTGMDAIVMSSILQAAGSLVAESRKSSVGTWSPAGLDALRVEAGCPAEMLAWVRYSKGSGPRDDIARLDIDLVDSQGLLCLQMRSLQIDIQSPQRASVSREEIEFAAGDAGMAEGWEHVPPANRQTVVEAFLKQEVASQLRKSAAEIVTDLTYFDLGLTSLGVTNLVRKTNDLLDVQLSPSVIFEYRNIQSFAAYLVETFPEALGALRIARRKVAECASNDPRRNAPPLSRKRPGVGSWARSMASNQGSETSALHISSELVLEQISWQDDASVDNYEKLTF